MSSTDTTPIRPDDVRTVAELHRRLADAGTRRACVVLRDGGYRVFVDHAAPGAKPLLPALAPYLPPPSDWEHEAIFIGRPTGEYPGMDVLFFAFVHSTRRGLAQGGLRLRDYGAIGELRKLFEDGLRLSQAMTLKNATAGLWWGGGKGIIAETPELAANIRPPAGGSEDHPGARAYLFGEYGRMISEMGGIYYTAADMNTDNLDMLHVLRTTRFVTCLPEHAGGSADPSPYTARGVLRSIQAGWKVLRETDSLVGVRVAVQGAGKVGVPLVVDLLEAGAHVWVGDLDPRAFDALREGVAKAREGGRSVDLGRWEAVSLAADPDAVLAQDVDIISPCAAGQVVNAGSIARFSDRVTLVCGAANNMLANEDRDAALLHDRGICYVPDFVCNRIGIVNCADEWMGSLTEDSWLEVDRLGADVTHIVTEWKARGIPTLETARAIAHERLSIPHPLERMRGRGVRLLERYLGRLHPSR